MSSSNIAIHRFRSWSEFKTSFREHLLLDKDAYGVSRRFLFRGEQAADWELESSFGRQFGWPTEKNGLEKALVTCSNLLNLFRENCATEKDVQGILNKLLDMLALARHHELPTPALDWSESPYVAAHFAYHEALCKSPKKAIENLAASNQMVAIWALDRTNKSVWSLYTDTDVPKKWVEPIMGDKFEIERFADKKILLFRSSEIHNERLSRQRGWMTYQVGNQDPLEHFIAGLPSSGPVLWKFELPLKDARVAMSDLHDMRINSMELMPDNDGRARHAVERAILEQL